jgi:hypothetical protein
MPPGGLLRYRRDRQPNLPVRTIKRLIDGRIGDGVLSADLSGDGERRLVNVIDAYRVIGDAAGPLGQLIEIGTHTVHGRRVLAFSQTRV